MEPLFGEASPVADWIFDLIGLAVGLMVAAAFGYKKGWLVTPRVIFSVLMFGVGGAFLIGSAIEFTLEYLGSCPSGRGTGCVPYHPGRFARTIASAIGTWAGLLFWVGVAQLSREFKRLKVANVPTEIVPGVVLLGKPQEPTNQARVFISYRREGDAGQAGRIADRLGNEFGPNHIFMDVDAMRLGFDFVEIINEEVAKCNVLLAVIGSRWIELLDTNKTNPMDFVRLEIAAALKRKIPVIPILVDGTKIPPADRLPEELQGLERRHALDLRNQSFRADMDRLVRELKSDKSS